MKYSNLIAFVIGAGVGSFATWYYIKDKYEKIAQEEIDSVKRVFSINSKVQEETPDQNDRAEMAKSKPDINEYAKKISEERYTDYSKISESMESDSDEEDSDEGKYKFPYVIPPEEYGENDYTKISLSYTSDHILLDENYEVIDNVDETVGLESLNHFGEYEDDSVFVRNDRLKVDYEILLDQRRYSDIVKSNPYLMGVLDYDDE